MSVPAPDCPAIVAASVVTWGNFQSLFQLSVAANLAFAALLDLMRDLPEKKSAEAHALGGRAAEAGEFQLAREIFLLSNKFTDARTVAEKLVFETIGPVCLGLGLISLLFLLVSSRLSNDSINWVFQLWSILEYIPFIVGIVIVVRSVLSIMKNSPTLEAHSAKVILAERSKRTAFLDREGGN